MKRSKSVLAAMIVFQITVFCLLNCGLSTSPGATGEKGSASVSVFVSGPDGSSWRGGISSRGLLEDPAVDSVTVSAYDSERNSVGWADLTAASGVWKGKITVSETGLLAFEALAKDVSSATLYRGWCTSLVTGSGDSVTITMQGLVGLAGEWLFDGDAIDTSGNGHDGSVGAGVVPTTDRFGKSNAAYGFDGSGTASIIAAGVPIDSSAGAHNTVSLWLKKDSGMNENCILFAWDGDLFDFQFDDGHIGINTGNNDQTGIAEKMIPGVWHHVAVNFINGITESGNTELFIDGVRQNISLWLGSGAADRSATQDVRISGWTYSGGYQFKGVVDDVRIYNRALSAGEISALYHEGGWNTSLTSPGATVGEWLFSGDANDSSGYGRHGTVAGPLLTSDRFGAPGRAYSFDGVDDHIDVGSLVSRTVGSISVWSLYDVTDSYRVVFSWGEPNANSVTLTEMDGEEIGFSLYGSTSGSFVYSDAPIFMGTWIHTVCTWDPDGAQKVYRNGRLMNSAAYMEPRIADSGRFGMCMWGSYPLEGKIDDIRVYDRALTDGEVSTLYHECGWDPKPAATRLGLVGEWLFGGDGNDSGGGGYHGAVNGATYASDRFGASGAALSLDGDDYVGVPTISIENSISVSAWVQTPSWTSVMYIAHKAPVNSNWEFLYMSSQICTGGPSSQLFYPVHANDNWQHIVMTQTGTTAKIYVDGILGASSESVTPIENGSGQIEFGRYDAPGAYFIGRIDDIRIYNRVLTALEIIDLAREGGY